MMGWSRGSVVLLGVLGAGACTSSGEEPGGVNAGGRSDTGGASATAGNNASGAGGGTGGSGSPPAAAGGAAGGAAMTGGGSGASGGAAGGSGTAGPSDGGAGSARRDGGSFDAGQADVVVPPRVDSGAVDPGTAGDGEFTIGTFTTQPDLTDRGAPKGRSFRFTMDSTKSMIFDGTDSTLVASKPRLLTRQIDVYVPALYKDGTPAPILVIQDGPREITQISRAVDNLSISTDPARKLPAFVVIAVQNGGNDAQGSERGLEYDTMSDRYARFVQLEVLPAIVGNAQIKAAYPQFAITDDPEGKATYGCSSGAAAAFTMAWFRPDLFRRVISYSGTFVAQQTNGQPEAALYPLGAWEYHSSKALIANTDPPKPIRAFLNVNSMDNGYTAAESGHHNWLLANQHMAAALKAKNYHYRYVLANGLGHCDARAWQATLADALVWVWSGYPTN